MGGYGSGRWNSYTKRLTAEESKRLSVRSYRETIRSMERGEYHTAALVASWVCDDRPSGNVRLLFEHHTVVINARLQYSITKEDKPPTKLDYSIGLNSTLTPWQARRYWWNCPGCGRRCETLYLPPGAAVFKCRMCWNLTYRVCQESHQYDRFLEMLLAESKITFAEFNAYTKPGRQRRTSLRWQRKLDNVMKLEAERARRYQHYLTPESLCEQSGLCMADLERLGAARLLLPDHEGRYRPKLAGWARKLAYLLREGWDVDTINQWAKGRWKATNPHAWPPHLREWTDD